jgi:hypothetical protein
MVGLRWFARHYDPKPKRRGEGDRDWVGIQGQMRRSQIPRETRIGAQAVRA